ncbi:hypothetical protein ACIB24_22555 [Spongisporangium articulatum]|uniref:WXG100 family type VII secretion target n=1 Tax=Spongisporangium articulatum TaxID=3362603 RepID=A0ABW8AW63_9ACTN
MPIDTGLPGDAGALRSLAGWLTGSLRGEIDRAAADYRTVVSDASTGWRGAAGEAFAGRVVAGETASGRLADGAGGAADAVTSYADGLAAAQRNLALIRDYAAAAGLPVAGDVIGEPTPLGAGASPAASATLQTRVQTYNQALADTDRVNLEVKVLQDALRNALADLRKKWFFTAADLIGGTAGDLLTEAHVSNLKTAAGELDDYAKTLRARAYGQSAEPGRVLDRGQFYDDLDRSAAAARDADGLAKSAEGAEKVGGRLMLGFGGALAVADAAYDIHNGKPVAQAVVSSGASFGASVAAGAVIGSFIPVPVVGTAVGALGGAAVGVFTSGMVDSLFENHGDVADAIGDGVSEVGDAGKAIGHLAEDAWDTIF